MASNAKSEFRRVNVDQYDEEKFPDEDDDQKQTEDSAANFDIDLKNLISQGDHLNALISILNRPHKSSLSQIEKDQLVLFIIRILLAFKSTEIDSVIKKLNSSQLDLLMKYIYRGFEFPTECSSAHLLLWHDKIYSIGGIGCIIRVLTERKRV